MTRPSSCFCRMRSCSARTRGIFHGGVVAALLDTTGSGAVMAGHDFAKGSRLTTISLSVQYLSVAPR